MFIIYFIVSLLTTVYCFPWENQIHPDTFLTTIELIQRYGYPSEEYKNIKTPDGYLLTMHRIPHGKRNAAKKRRPVVFLMHGLVCSSGVFVSSGADKSLGFILADAGYDVWMGNARGNTYCREHVTYDADRDSEFWQFSWHEIGVIDLPTMIDYVLRATKQKKLYYIGHSQGTTTFFVMCAEKQEYNEKIQLMIALAPVAYMSHLGNPVIRLVAPFTNVLGFLTHLIGMDEFLPSHELIHLLGEDFCNDNSPFQEVCSNFLFLMSGWDSEQLNRTMLPVITSNIPAGSSTKQLLHYGQETTSGRFCQFDYGYRGNLKKYQSDVPPDYNIFNIKAPIALFYGKNDFFAAVADVEKFAHKLPNLIKSYLVPHPKFNHLDFLYAINAKEFVYDPILSLFKKHPLS